MPLLSRTASVQSLISWAWLSWLPNRLAGQGPRRSGAAPWPQLLLSLPAGKQQRRSQPHHSTWHLAWRGQAAAPSLSCPPVLPSYPPAPPWSFALCCHQHLHSWVTPGISQWLQLEGQRLEVKKDFPTPRMVGKGIGSEEEWSGHFGGPSYAKILMVCPLHHFCKWKAHTSKWPTLLWTTLPHTEQDADLFWYSPPRAGLD